jgi:AmmeMemoRadiSam system protein B
VPSPLPDREGLLVRDPYRYAEQMIIVPLPLVPCLAFFNGATSVAEAKEMLVRVAGDVRIGSVLDGLHDALSSGGFLEDAAFESMKTERHRAFRESLRREPAHAGAAYPAEEALLRKTLAERLNGGSPAHRERARDLLGIAAPHVSPEGGWSCYQAAYGVLNPTEGDKTFVILGTSHYGEPDAFGLTRKPFVTPLGEAPVDLDMVDFLAEKGGTAARIEDYCHAVEHSIEFQVVFLQGIFGPNVRIVPILCGPYVRGMRAGGRPEEDAGVARFLSALAELQAREGSRLLWVLGVDMAHVGRHYGDEKAARAEEGEMVEVAHTDRRRCESIARGDADGFWSMVQEGGDGDDALKWCGASPFYAFLRSVAPASGELLRYQQWNIDEESVVSFAGMAFYKAEGQMDRSNRDRAKTEKRNSE